MARHVLVVDDDVSTLKLLKVICERKGYVITTSENVPDALRSVQKIGVENLACILTDFRMPGQTGLELVEEVKTIDPTLAFIILTAEGEKSIITSSLRAGVSDFLDKPVDLDILFKALDRASILTEKQREERQMRSSVSRVARAQQFMSGLKGSSGVQHICETPSVRVFFDPRHGAGGDFVSLVRHDKEQTVLLAADVSGHDLEAAFISAYFQGLFRGMIERGATPIEAFRFFNRFLLEEWAIRDVGLLPVSLAACCLMIEKDSGRIQVLNNGFPSPVLIHPNGNATFTGDGASPLGWFDELDTSIWEGQIGEGGRLVLWSDGLSDLADTRSSSPLLLAQSVLYDHYLDTPVSIGGKGDDDVLIVWIDPTAISPENEESQYVPFYHDSYRGDGQNRIDAFQNRWEQALLVRVPDCSPDAIYSILLCIRESLLNAMLHGCKSDGKLETCLTISYRQQSGHVRVRVEDPGHGHIPDFSHHFDSDVAQEHCGLFLISQMAESLAFEKNGATIVADFRTR